MVGKRKLLCVTFMALLLTGCNLIPSRSRVENITPQMIAAQDMGIVILTTGAPGVCKAVYVGELFLTTGCALEGLFDIRDYYERDMEMVRRRNPALVATAPTKELLRLGEPMRFEQNARP